MGLRELLLKGIAVIVVGVIGTLFVLHEDSSVHAGIFIDRPLADVWNVVSDSTAYADWNPFITRVDGDFREGEHNPYCARQWTGFDGVQADCSGRSPGTRPLLAWQCINSRRFRRYTLHSPHGRHWGHPS